MCSLTPWRVGKMIVILGVALCGGCATLLAQTPVAVRFAVTGCWGTPIAAATIHVYSVERQATVRRFSYPVEDAATLERGHYHTVIEANGFFSFSSAIELSDNDIEVRACLTVAPIEGTTRPWVKLTGSVTPESKAESKSLWVRLVGLYSDANLTATVGTRGQFSFSRLQPGRYLLILFDKNGIRSQEEVDVREGRGPVTLPHGSSHSSGGQ